MRCNSQVTLDPTLEGVLATALDAVVVMTGHGLVTGWNSVAEATFGWTADEALGRSLGQLVVPPEHREAHQEGLLRLAAGGEPHVINRRIEISALHRDGREFPVELSITTAPTSAGEVYVGFIRDIAKRREVEQKVEREAVTNRLLFEVASMAADSESFNDALRKALGAICEITTWPVGHAFVVPVGNQKTARSSGVWFEMQSGMADQLRALTEDIEFTPGVGLPGTILQCGEAQWVTDTAAEDNFVRKDCGFRGAFGFPLKSGGRIVAILEFFSQSPVQPDPATLMLVQALGEQVGRVFERLRTHDHETLLLHELNHRMKNIIAVVQAVAHQTFRSAATLQEAQNILQGRLVAIARAQDLLISKNIHGTSLQQLIEGSIAGSGVDSKKVSICGPEVPVSSRDAVTISLAVHEMCTNSMKYGAFSDADGQVDIEWGLDEMRESFFFSWTESGGPTVKPPTRKGFGSSLLEKGLASDLGGSITLDYRPEGLVCRFVGPAPKLFTEAPVQQ
ncbi:HWE histidine kinase domain-containing protein [Erythrobacter sp. SD-21]|uniref:HWE histidine kinase domain-containing protein n=1 Tax=Erythrobacter sp. SD-21 TaxID=161528 RepID=UPI000153F9B2|nr:HWE histidine kinase domain-containing protein [Erythrobacter sp. SD-21]EDL48481.1 sensor histidine kinase, putative [Erythrobacter sp. SD-21]